MAGVGGVARSRLAEERKAWRRNHPHGFIAKPATSSNGTMDLMIWNCIVPGKSGTDWEGGYFPVTLNFTEDYPSRPPKCSFPPSFFHPNVYPCGRVCLSILGDCWSPSITVKQILLGLQELLDQPNPASAAQGDVSKLLVLNKEEYRRQVRLEAKKYPAPR
ncbi:SUMO-conjugating enzyme SCE1-like protein [Drosera capensis]